MEEIKEVALRVARRDFPANDVLAVVACVEEVLAELQKDAAPVAWTRPDATYSFITHRRKLANEYQADRLYSVPLYTHPHPKAATVPEVQIPRSALTEFINKFCCGNSALVACAEAAFFAFNQSLSAAPSLPAQSNATTAWKSLTDVQWMNIVNHDHAYENYSKEDAVHEAVKRTEAKLKELNDPAAQSEGEQK